ncbi:MAG: hypothetical protein U0872_05635 [Planctomycetaceae bacterium]
MEPISPSKCPEADELRQLLDNSLSGDRTQEYTRHMDSCACCQSKLEQLATSGTNLSEVLSQLDGGEPAAESAYWPALACPGSRFSGDGRPGNSSQKRKDLA